MALNDPEPRFQDQASGLTLSISEIAKDMATVTMEGE